MGKLTIRKIMNIVMIVSILLTSAFVFYGMSINLFSSESVLKNFLKGFGLWAPIIFIAFQILQVVLPVLPGGIGLLGGVVLFGPFYGFIYNYIGICLGSAIAFLIARHYGMPIIEALFSSRLKHKYISWRENKEFPKLFAIAIFMPIAPDDFLCYLAGTTNMTFKRFASIIVLGKPTAIAAYTFGLHMIFHYFFKV